MFLKWLIVFLLLGGGVHATEEKQIFCYYDGTRDNFVIEDINPTLCTHLVYGQIGVKGNGELLLHNPLDDDSDNDKWSDDKIEMLNELKMKNPSLKTLAAIGAWSVKGENFSSVVDSTELRLNFVQNVVKFANQFGWDGFVLDSTFDGKWDERKIIDRDDYVSLLKELRHELSRFDLLFTVFVFGPPYVASVLYDIPEISKNVDYIIIKAYDFQGGWEDKLAIHGALYGRPADDPSDRENLNVDSVMKYWVGQGVPRNKLIMAVDFYGRGFHHVFDMKNTRPGSPQNAPDSAKGSRPIGYYEVCHQIKQKSWYIAWDVDQKSHYAYNNTEWVSYESPRRLNLKAKYVVKNDFAGVMVVGVQNDDFSARCSNEKYPLLKTLLRIFFKGRPTGVARKKDCTCPRLISPVFKEPLTDVPCETRKNCTCPKVSSSVFLIAGDKGRQPAVSECKESEMPRSTKKLFPQGVSTTMRSSCSRDPDGQAVSHCTLYVQFADGTGGHELNAIVQFNFNSEYFDRTSVHLF